MKLKFAMNHMLKYFNDQSVEIRIRMMYFLEYASVLACFIGTIFMILLKQPIVTMFPNIILFVMAFISLYFSHIKKKYELSTLILIVGCANIAVPWMFFSAGGNNSGMHIWLIFSVVVTCMMANGKMRIFLTAFTIIEDLVCMYIGNKYPDFVIPLVGENAEFVDQIQSFAVVCVCLSVMLTIYITTYDRQHKKLEEQSLEMKRLVQTDALTGMYNRHAYYEEINGYKSKGELGNLVVVAMDLNGLKKVNDMSGHAAGDAYICAAAKVMNQALSEYGNIFRIGGDEFTALLHCSVTEAHGFEERIKECIAKADDNWSKQMTIAVGVVCCEENPSMDLVAIEKLADEKMYENKANFYSQSGVDRRSSRRADKRN